MEKYSFKGNLFLAEGQRGLPFEGFFLRNSNGFLKGRFFSDSLSFDSKDEIYGSLVREENFSKLDKKKFSNDNLVFFHTRDKVYVDRVYWFSRLTRKTGSFEGVYSGIKEGCLDNYLVKDVRDYSGWNVNEILSKTSGSRIEIFLKKENYSVFQIPKVNFGKAKFFNR